MMISKFSANFFIFAEDWFSGVENLLLDSFSNWIFLISILLGSKFFVNCFFTSLVKGILVGVTEFKDKLSLISAGFETTVDKLDTGLDTNLEFEKRFLTEL